MNKKLFSWKALAGLALLVAMGLTSCNNNTVVDPNDPYNVNKPVKPGTSTAGDADLTFTITNATGGDLATLWANWKANNADAAKELMKKTEVTIGLNFANYKLDGNEVAIPQFVTTTKGSVINLVVTGFAEAKKAFNLSTKNLDGAEVNITLPATEFDMVLDGSASKVTLMGSGASVKTLKATASTNKQKALTVADGVTVKGINMKGALAGTDNVEAKLISASETLVEGKGAQVGSEEVYVKSLVVTANATVSGAAKTALKNITVNEGVVLTLGDKKSEIASIKGVGDLTDATKRSIVKLAGDADDFSKISALENVYIQGTTATKVSDFSIFENVIFNTPVDLHTSAANTTFLKLISASIDEDVNKIAFTNVDFGTNSTINVSGANKTNKNSLIRMYEYDLSSETYVIVKDNDSDNLSAANKKKEGVDVAQNYFSSIPSTIKMTTDGTFNFKTTYTYADKTTEPIDEAKLKKALADAEKAYKDAAATTGWKTLNQPGQTLVENYIGAWVSINGSPKVTWNTDKAIGIEPAYTSYDDANAAAAKEVDNMIKGGKLTPKDADEKAAYVKDWTFRFYGKARSYANYWNFVTDVNAKIKDSSWFTIYYTQEKTIQPEGVVVAFDACKVNGKELSLEKLNSLIYTKSSTFTSAKDAWFTVTLDGEALQWGKYTDGTYYLK